MILLSPIDKWFPFLYKLLSDDEFYTQSFYNELIKVQESSLKTFQTRDRRSGKKNL